MKLYRKLPWWAAILIIWFMAFWGLRFVLGEYNGDPLAIGLTPVVAYIAALLAVAGWMVQAYVSVRSSRKQHSITVLFQTRMSPEYQRNLQLVNDRFPNGQMIPFEVIDEDANRAVYNATVFILNYYEFISVGIAHGDLDESIIRDCIRSQFLSFTARSAELIKRARGEDINGNADPLKSHSYRDLCRIRSRWRSNYWRQNGAWP